MEVKTIRIVDSSEGTVYIRVNVINDIIIIVVVTKDTPAPLTNALQSFECLCIRIHVYSNTM